MAETTSKTQNRPKFIFKVLSIGDFVQDMPDGVTILCRPCIKLGDDRKKWGNEYILFSRVHEDSIRSGQSSFFGLFGVDKNRKKQLRLFEDLNIPIRHPDYYVMSYTHKGDKFEKDFDLQKADPKSYSQIFSSAFHLHEDTDEFECQSILILQHGDHLEINGKSYMFSGKSETLEEVK